MRDILRLGLTLMAYALTAGAALAFVGIKTMPVIAENLARAEEEARDAVLPGMNGGFERFDSDGFAYWTGYRDEAKSDIGGYIFVAQGAGYSSEIRTMVAVDEYFSIINTKVMFQQETPGLGTKIAEVESGEKEPRFMSQFRGISVDGQAQLRADGGEIDAISGATVSSRAVADSIDRGRMTLLEIVGGNR